MSTEMICPLVDNTCPCPAMALLREILDKMETLDQKMDGIEVKSKKLPKIAHLSVNALIVALQIEHPEKVWSSDSFAEKIGCTGAAVRKTEQWKNYQERLEREKETRPKHNGTKDKQGNVEAVAGEE